MRRACLTKHVLCYAKKSCSHEKYNRNSIKESAKLPLRIARQIIINLFKAKKTIRIKSYLPDTGS